MKTRTVSLILISLILMLSSCGSPSYYPELLTGTQVLVSPAYSVTSLPPSPSAEPHETEDPEPADMAAVNTDKQNELAGILLNPHENGYGFLPFKKPGIKEADKKKFNPDKLTDYLVSGLDELGGFYFIDKAKLIKGNLNIVIEYNVYADPDSAYQYLKKTFELSDDYIMSLKLFSETDCRIENGRMCSYFGSEHSICTGIPIVKITLPRMAVADDAVITIEAGYGDEIALHFTTAQFADYILHGKNATNHIPLNNVWFKYSDGIITGIAEEYAS